MKIERFEDMEVWQLTRKLVKEVYEVTENTKFSRDIDLKRQMRRSGISILSNISEGFERRSNKEFVYFLFVSKGSAGELRSQICIAKDLNFINENLFNSLTEELIVISKSLSGLIKYLKKTEI